LNPTCRSSSCSSPSPRRGVHSRTAARCRSRGHCWSFPPSSFRMFRLADAVVDEIEASARGRTDRDPAVGLGPPVHPFAPNQRTAVASHIP
jgi:hypothetical protein